MTTTITIEEILAQEVKKRPFLYDKSNELYSNRVTIESAWTEIAKHISNHFGTPLESLFDISWFVNK